MASFWGKLITFLAILFGVLLMLTSGSTGYEGYFYVMGFSIIGVLCISFGGIYTYKHLHLLSSKSPKIQNSKSDIVTTGILQIVAGLVGVIYFIRPLLRYNYSSDLRSYEGVYYYLFLRLLFIIIGLILFIDGLKLLRSKDLKYIRSKLLLFYFFIPLGFIILKLLNWY